eukprot:s483_g13.t4
MSRTTFQSLDIGELLQGQFYNSLLAMSVQLVDHAPGDGGFCVIRGSHKLNFAVPPDFLHGVGAEAKEHFYQPTTRAGDVIFFSEATVHGAMAWNAEHERRIAIYRFAPATVAYGRSYSPSWPKEMLEDLTSSQRAVLEPPYAGDGANMARQWSKGVSGASWLEAGAAETELEESEASESPATSSDQAELEPGPPVRPAEEVEPRTTSKVEQYMSNKFLELQFQEVCHCVQNSNDDLFARLEGLFERQAERQHDLQTKLDAITEDETARFMARMARDMVQAEPSPKPPSCAPSSLPLEKPEPPGVVTPPGEAEPRPFCSFWSSPDLADDAAEEAEIAVTSRTSEMSLASDLTPPTTTLLQREDEAAYQAALAKAKRLQHRETKRLTRQVSSSHSEHWQTRLRDFMQTALMESICAGIIFTNSILIGVQTDYMAKRLGEEQPLVFTVVDAAYTAIFGLELAVRLLGSGLGFFYRHPGLFWNYLAPWQRVCRLLPLFRDGLV